MRGPQFVAFQNAREHWSVIYDIADVGDVIAVLRIGSSDLPHLVGADQSGAIYWYENPRLTCGRSRAAPIGPST
jgi:hypothetical protein